MNELKQSASVVLKLGPFLDSTDGNSVEPGLTIAQANVRLSKNGGDFAQKGNASSSVYDEAGFYNSTVSVVDTGTLGRLKVAVHMTGSLAVWHDYAVVDKNYWTSKYSSDVLDVNTIQVGRTVQTALDINDILTDTAELQTDDIPGRLDTLSASVTVIDGNVDLTLADTNELQTDDIPGRIDTLSGTLATILADTGELQTDDIPGRLDTLSASVSAIPTVMVGTDGANTTVPDAAGVVPGRLDTLSASVTVIDGNVDLTLADTNELQGDDIPGRLDTISGSLTVITADTNELQTDDIPGRLDTISGSLTVITADTNELQTDDIPGRLDTISGSVTVIDGLLSDARGEPGQGALPVSTSSVSKQDYIYKFLRNKITNNGTDIEVYNDAGNVVDHKAPVSVATGTVTRGEFVTGP